MTCPRCGARVEDAWYTDVIFADVEPAQELRYWECNRCGLWLVRKGDIDIGSRRV